MSGQKQPSLPSFLPLPRPSSLPPMRFQNALNAHPKPLLKAGRHPTLPLTIYNYSDSAQFRNKWNETTLEARGLVLENETGSVVARPFQKFFNYDETQHAHLQDTDFQVTEKVDGSMGIYFHYNGQWIFASRGSFTSEQANEGQKLAQAAGLDKICDPDYTYVFELIYPQNRVVIRYGNLSELVLLGKMRTATGEEAPPDLVGIPGIRLPKTYPKDTFDNLLARNTSGEEGYVLLFPSGERVKMKFEDYILLSKTKARFSPSIVVSWLKNDFKDTAMNHAGAIPDEFHAEAADIEMKVRAKYTNSKHRILEKVKKYNGYSVQSVPNDEDKGVVCQVLKVKQQGIPWEPVVERAIWTWLEKIFPK